MTDLSAYFTDLQPQDERTSLEQRLRFIRRAVVAKIEDLTDAQAAARPLPASNMSVGGVVKHLAEVEHFWFGLKLLGVPWPEPWASAPLADDPDWAFTSSARDSVADLLALYDDACAASLAAAARFDSLDALAAEVSFGTKPVNLRWVLIHVNVETAWHVGHLDLLRDAIDAG